MKTTTLVICLLLLQTWVYAQSLNVAEITQKLSQTLPDSERVNLLNVYSSYLLQSDNNKASKYIEEAFLLAQKAKYKRGQGYAYLNLAILQDNYWAEERWGSIGEAITIFEEIKDKKGFVKGMSVFAVFYRNKGDYPKALEYYYNAMLTAESENYKKEKKMLSVQIGYIYALLGDNQWAKVYQENYTANEALLSPEDEAEALGLLGEINTKGKKYEEALECYRKAATMAQSSGLLLSFQNKELNIANVLCELGRYDEAEKKAKNILASMNNSQQNAETLWGELVLGKIFFKTGNLDKALSYAERVYLSSEGLNLKEFSKESAELLYQIYQKKGNTKLFLFYKNQFKAIQDSLSGEQARQLTEVNQTSFELENQKNQIALLRKESEINQVSLKNQQILLYSSVALAVLFMGFMFVLFRNNRIQKKYNYELSQQKQEIVQQKEELQKTLDTLKATQAQLIQSEKLASLGELTAGIAHEIQNPLNFVNNFSELSVELAKELKEERLKVKGERDEELENELVDDLIQNQEKINLHGKRASSIVKGMLEHSRASTGVKELTDINKLADEYLRLSYHGLRAKDSSFNADFELIADETLPKINVIPQDIGRVLLNLINNAFQSSPLPAAADRPDGGNNKKLKVILSTKFVAPPSDGTPRGAGGAIIRVTDNGSGIPADVLPKIFQPFFTTKPTGQGTGLGLSLAYDIVTKGHGGTIEVESLEGEGTTFILKLPI
jgi:two-component system, NtrC family, sensor kinase